ncbi:MAG: hypothetical protein WB509_29530 [Acetobacteraceae bacterium]
MHSGITDTLDPTFDLVHPTVSGDDVMCRLMDRCQAPIPSFKLEIDALRRHASQFHLFSIALSY